MLSKVEIEKKANQKRVAGEYEKNQGQKAYNNTGWGVYGLFATVDNLQSKVTGYAATNEVAQMRKGDRLTQEADALNKQNTPQ